MEATVSAKSVVHAITEEICRAVSSEVSRFLGTSCSIGSVRCTPVLSLNGFPIEEKNELKNITYQLKMSWRIKHRRQIHRLFNLSAAYQE